MRETEKTKATRSRSHLTMSGVFAVRTTAAKIVFRSTPSNAISAPRLLIMLLASPLVKSISRQADVFVSFNPPCFYHLPAFPRQHNTKESAQVATIGECPSLPSLVVALPDAAYTEFFVVLHKPPTIASNPSIVNANATGCSSLQLCNTSEAENPTRWSLDVDVPLCTSNGS
jgi:hypothetical protein